MAEAPGRFDRLNLLRARAQRIAASGFLSPEFQAWHADVLSQLRKVIGENDSLYKEFCEIQFEVPPELLDFYQKSWSMVAWQRPEEWPDSSYTSAPANFRDAARAAMRSTLDSLPPEKRALLDEATKHLREASFPVEWIQQAHFEKALILAEEILLVATHDLDDE